MTTAYVVTRGEYSDYEICGVCSDKEQAAKLAKWVGGGGIETYEVDQFRTAIERGLTAWEVRFVGEKMFVRHYPEGLLAAADAVRGHILYCADLTSRGCGYKRITCIIDVLADTEKRAVKVASERWAQLRVEVVPTVPPGTDFDYDWCGKREVVLRTWG
jgi:hypothetical protein